MNDAIETIRQYLAEPDTALYALCGNRIAAPVFPVGDSGTPVFANEAPAIMFYQESGTSEAGAVGTTDGYYIFRCYGGSGSYADARTVFRVLHDRLHSVSANTEAGGIMAAYCVSQIQSGAEPDTGYPVHISRFMVTVT